MKITLYLAALLILFTSFSASPLPKYQGLLTDDYGIVSLADLDEHGQQDPWQGFTGDDVDHYWFCIEPSEYFFDCENLGDINYNYEDTQEHWDIGQPTFWIKAGGEIYNFGTRRNWSIEHCSDMKKDILWLMQNEPVVCLSGRYLKPDETGNNWILDRVKTQKGAWSWFVRSGYNIGLPSKEDEQTDP